MFSFLVLKSPLRSVSDVDVIAIRVYNGRCSFFQRRSHPITNLEGKLPGLRWLLHRKNEVQQRLELTRSGAYCIVFTTVFYPTNQMFMPNSRKVFFTFKFEQFKKAVKFSAMTVFSEVIFTLLREQGELVFENNSL